MWFVAGASGSQGDVENQVVVLHKVHTSEVDTEKISVLQKILISLDETLDRGNGVLDF